MAKTLTLCLTLAAALGLPAVWGTPAPAQDAPRDEALDGLLKKLEEKDARPADAPSPRADPAKPGPAKPAADKPEAKPAAKPGDKDAELENLLEKLGSSPDTPTPEDRPSGPGGGRGEPKPGDQPPADAPDKDKDKDKKKEKEKDPDALSGKDKALDEHIEEILGKRKKKKPQGDGGGALSQVIKEMREVEERLGKPDTGEETRKKQEQIVKQIETLIEQSRAMQGQPQGKKKSMKVAQGKSQPGQSQNGEQPGTTGGNAPFTKPEKPNDRRSLAGGKEVWGMLPPEVRQELDNVSKEGFLLSREELIQRYYLSLSKKKTNRGE